MDYKIDRPHRALKDTQARLGVEFVCELLASFRPQLKIIFWDEIKSKTEYKLWNQIYWNLKRNIRDGL